MSAVIDAEVLSIPLEATTVQVIGTTTMFEGSILAKYIVLSLAPAVPISMLFVVGSLVPPDLQ